MVIEKTFDDKWLEIKQVAGVETDADLAKALGISVTAVADAKKRQSIPAPWQDRLTGGKSSTGLCPHCRELYERLLDAAKHEANLQIEISNLKARLAYAASHPNEVANENFFTVLHDMFKI